MGYVIPLTGYLEQVQKDQPLLHGCGSQKRPVLDQVGHSTGALGFYDDSFAGRFQPEIAKLEPLQDRQVPAGYVEAVGGALAAIDLRLGESLGDGGKVIYYFPLIAVLLLIDERNHYLVPSAKIFSVSVIP